MEQQFAAPVKQVAFARLQVRGGFVFVGCFDKLSVFFFYFSQQVVQFRRILLFQQVPEQALSVREPPSLQVCKRKVVAVIVGRRIDLLSLLQV